MRTCSEPSIKLITNNRTWTRGNVTLVYEPYDTASPILNCSLIINNEMNLNEEKLFYEQLYSENKHSKSFAGSCTLVNTDSTKLSEIDREQHITRAIHNDQTNRLTRGIKENIF